MQHRLLARTGVRLSVISLGTMMFGRGVNENVDECTEIIHRSLDAGINHIDTADGYGKGESERIVGSAIAWTTPLTMLCWPQSASFQAAPMSTNAVGHGGGSGGPSRPPSSACRRTTSTSSICTGWIRIPTLMNPSWLSTTWSVRARSSMPAPLAPVDRSSSKASRPGATRLYTTSGRTDALLHTLPSL